MKITHAQPLVLAEYAACLEPTPLLSCAEAEVEARALLDDVVVYTLQALENVSPRCLGQPIETVLAVGGLSLYTHYLHVVEAPEHTCRNYLVRVADDTPCLGRSRARAEYRRLPRSPG
jgi:hypothetical protein